MSADVTLTVRRFRTGSIFRIVAAGCFFSLVPFFLLMGILAFFGMSTLTWNGQPIYGTAALLASPVMGVFAAAFMTGIGGAGLAFGLWLYSKLRPLNLRALPETSSFTPPGSE